MDTVQDCESREPVSIRMEQAIYIPDEWPVMSCAKVVFTERTTFICLQGSEASGNVYLDCQAVNPYSN